MKNGTMAAAAVAAMAWAAWTGAASGQEFGREDGRAKRALEEAGLRYRIDEDWRFLLVMDGAEEDRTQLVVVPSRTAWLEDWEIREVSGVGYSGAPLGKKRLLELLEGNARYKAGAWEVSPVETDGDDGPGQQVRFCVKLDADAPSETLRTAVECVAEMCDRLEADWMGTDEY
ncbi:MAG: hypothetical protein IK066_10685 [Kiritimatiellae bacterium]|nr:hypothetical protein [Kiritimatiellia bacterium]